MMMVDWVNIRIYLNIQVKFTLINKYGYYLSILCLYFINNISKFINK